MVRRVIGRVAVATACLGMGHTSLAAAADGQDATLHFDFDSDRYLVRGQSRGSLAYIPQALPQGASAPIVVFLHGLNPKQVLHPWFNGDPGDLREEARRLVQSGDVLPFLIAAPTQSKAATIPQKMWPSFDLDRFLQQTERALGERAHIDRTKVILVGHSGGGCNPQGGIVAATAHAKTHPLAVLAVDTCLEPELADGYLAAAPSTMVWVTWQRKSWTRPFDEFRRRLESGDNAKVSLPKRRCEEREPVGGTPHNAILPETLRRALPALLPPR